MNQFVLEEPDRVYFDHNATTPLFKEVRDKAIESLNLWGNPSSIHWTGRAPKTALRTARQQIANFVGAKPMELIFTGGGSEANNLAIKGCVEFLHKGRDKNLGPLELITTTIEHPSVTQTFKFLESKGYKVYWVPATRDGYLDLDYYKSVLSKNTGLVSIMFANNETGNLYPIKELCELAHEQGALFHSDCVQSLGKSKVNVKELGVDFASFSGHKFYSLKGCGFLYQKTGLSIENLIHGGGQERGRRAGTENTTGIVCLGEACRIGAPLLESKIDSMESLRLNLEKNILSAISDVVVNGSKAPRMANTLSLSIDGVDGESLLMNLDLKGFSVSTGAACSSGSPEPSPVLRAMGLSHSDAQSSLRISLGWGNTEEQISRFVETLIQVVSKLRSFKSQGE